MGIHLLTIVGKRITTLPQMLDHYVQLGVDSALIWVHLQDRGDPLREVVEEIARSRGLQVAGARVGDWLNVQFEVFQSVRAARPRDWFILADQDEFQVYPEDLHDVISECDAAGYDYVKGLFLDRFAADGRFAPMKPDQRIWSQFPIGAFFTYPILRGDPRKVVATKGPVELTNSGHHETIAGHPMPISECLVQVHHFKWVEGVTSYLQARSSIRIPDAPAVTIERDRLLVYLQRRHNRIDFDDPRIFAADCSNGYPHWDALTNKFLNFEPMAFKPPLATQLSCPLDPH